MRSFPDSHQEIIWLDISMQKMPAMNILDSLDHHVKEHQNRFGR
jgi:hypothetical protein